MAILMEGQKDGVSQVCRRVGISRTLYYRWLSRYMALGIDGLDVIQQRPVPSNKTNVSVAEVLLSIVKKEPHFGPRALKYRLEELEYPLSESAVYNVLKRYRLTTREARVKYSRQRVKASESQANNRLSPLKHDASHRDKDQGVPHFSDLSSGEGWVFWTTPIGLKRVSGTLYVYTFLDIVSRIACSRIYPSLSLTHLDNLLNAVALPVAQSLKLDARVLYVSMEDGLFGKKKSNLMEGLVDVVVSSKSELMVDATMDASCKITREGVTERQLKVQYNRLCLRHLMHLQKSEMDLEQMQGHLQIWLRHYNLELLQGYNGGLDTPVNYHAKAMQTELILPMWAYLDRSY